MRWVAAGLAVLAILVGGLALTAEDTAPRYLGVCIETGGVLGYFRDRLCDEEATDWCNGYESQVGHLQGRERDVCSALRRQAGR